MRTLATLLTFLLIGGVLPRCGGSGSGSDSSDDVSSLLFISLLTGSPRVVPRDQRSHRYLFVTASAHNGNFGGVSGADAVCNANVPAALTGSINYKALLVDGAARIATVTGDLGDGQTDWVLEANREYRRSDESRVFTANNVRLFGFTSGATLTNSFGASAGAFWTGLNINWTYVGGGGISCNAWTSASGGVAGEVGSASESGFASIHDNAETCDRTTRAVGGASIGLLCIEQ